MKNIIVPLLIIIIIYSCKNAAQQDPWTTSQLIETADLARVLNDSSATKPLIFNIGSAGLIKNAIDIGPVSERANYEKLKTELNKYSKNSEIIIYCGCCPFKDCPNVRPAFTLLNEGKFTNHKLLNISENLKVDWINKGYPL